MKFRVKRWVGVFLTVGVLGVAIGFVEKKHAARTCRRIGVRIENELGNYFISESDILDLITHHGNDPLVGNEFKNIDLKSLERRIKTNKFIRTSQVSRNLKGDLLVEVQQCVPIARIVAGSAAQAGTPDAYVSQTGQVLPLSDRFTARVVLVESEYARPLLEMDFTKAEEGQPFLELFRAIDQDPFWKAQIAELYVDRNGEITFLPQVGKQVIEFGTPTEIAAKLRKLKVFYKQILPVKGWDRYRRVSVKFRNQIVCE
ncbi:MAG: cell division protein FtsQ [Ferruginibacter sp.]|nr:cell division protein FtsQ [Cytophagales bacterium]